MSLMTTIVNESAESASNVASKGSDNVMVQGHQHGKVEGDHGQSDHYEIPRYTNILVWHYMIVLFL